MKLLQEAWLEGVEGETRYIIHTRFTLVYTEFTLDLHWFTLDLHTIYTGLHWIYTGLILQAYKKECNKWSSKVCEEDLKAEE